MNGRWLHHNAKPEAVVVFGGWAVGPACFAALPADRDVFFVDDYRSVEAELPALEGYGAVDLVAWSFGVAAFGHWNAGRPDIFRHKVALCGSLSPVDRRLGIAPRVYARTVQGLTQESYQQFQHRVFGRSLPEAHIDLDARRDELIAVEARGPAPDPGFDRVWAAEQDQIFALAAMEAAWADRDLKTFDGPHAPFDHFTSWEAFWA